LITIKDVMNAEPEDMMVRIGQAIETAQLGDRSGAQTVLMLIWETVGPDGDPLHRCAVAHSMADLQDDPENELLWDLRALEAAHLLTDDRLSAAGMAISAGGFYPSLYLNLADVYRRLGAMDRAREHVALGKSAISWLSDDGYRRMIQLALDRVLDQLPVS
jgi:hypothetical protein